MTASTTLKELGYYFNDKGELRRIEDDARFVFTTQEAYTKLGDAMTFELYGILERRCGLTKLEIPVDVENENGCMTKHFGFVYVSPGFENMSTVVLIIHGSGAVRPGQWSRRLILNESLEVGSQLPYIERVLKNNWGVIVCSTNTEEKLNNYACRHLCGVYENLLRDSAIERFFVIAHSRGGPDFASAYPHFKHEDRFAVVCMTDSVDFQPPRLRLNAPETEGPVFINWKADSKFQQSAISDEDITTLASRVHCIYAGTTEHERSSYTALNSVFHVLENWHSTEDFPKLLVEATGLASTGITEM